MWLLHLPRQCNRLLPTSSSSATKTAHSSSVLFIVATSQQRICVAGCSCNWKIDKCGERCLNSAMIDKSRLAQTRSTNIFRIAFNLGKRESLEKWKQFSEQFFKKIQQDNDPVSSFYSTSCAEARGKETNLLCCEHTCPLQSGLHAPTPPGPPIITYCEVESTGGLQTPPQVQSALVLHWAPLFACHSSRTKSY